MRCRSIDRPPRAYTVSFSTGRTTIKINSSLPRASAWTRKRYAPFFFPVYPTNESLPLYHYTRKSAFSALASAHRYFSIISITTLLFSPLFFSHARNQENRTASEIKRVIFHFTVPSFPFVIKKRKNPNRTSRNDKYIYSVRPRLERGKSDVRTSGGQWKKPPNYSVNWCLIGIR